MRYLWTVMAVAAAAMLGLSCGATTDGGGNADAGANGDAGVTCSFYYDITPDDGLTAPVTVVATAVVNDGGLTGVRNITWTVQFEGQDITPAPEGDNSQISFLAEQPGDYYIQIAGDIGGKGCTATNGTETVLDPNAGSRQYRLRLVPAPGQPAPVQERIIRVFGEIGASLPPISMDNGTEVGGTLKGPGDIPLAAYLRVAQVGSLSAAVETFADSAGEFSLWLDPSLHDFLVVPADETLAPMRFSSVNVTTLNELTITQGDAISGTVRDGAGQPLANARVSLRIDDVPSTIATTDGAGAFTVYGRAGGATTINVVPPAGSGLPQLDLDAGAGLVAASATPLAIQYAAGLSSRTVSVNVTRADAATPVPLAGTTWIADGIAAAGTVTPNGGSALDASGRVRVTAMANGSGAITGLTLPETSYTVLVEPTPSTPSSELLAMRSVDLSAGMPTPAALSLSAGATIQGVVSDDDQLPVSGVRVTASPRGAIANSPTTSGSAVTNAAGQYTLLVVGGGSYDLRYDSLANTHGQSVASVTAPAEGMNEQRNVTLADAVPVTAQVTIPGIPGGASGVSVTALCFDCTGPDAVRPVAEAVTGLNGVFTLAIPDPQAQAPPN